MESMSDNNTHILIVDDDLGALLTLKAGMVNAGIPEPVTLSDSRRVIDLIRIYHFKVVLLDIIMPHVTGIELLKQIKKEFPETVVIIMTALDDVATAVDAIKFGAYDYLVKPLNMNQLVLIVNRALERYNLQFGLSFFERKQLFAGLANLEAFKDIVSEDEKMAMLFHQVEAVSSTDYNVVITGESGVGKEKIARVMHNLSSRAKAPFIAVNMAAFSATLFEAEFFGYSKGAYTDAIKDKKGFFEQTEGGTLFLDEITELDMSLQGKLLRVIEERELYRIGSTRVRTIDVHLISATNRDINKEIEKGRFRADLYYRLNMYNIKIPPLRERKKDILPLARFFLKKYSKKSNKMIKSISNELSAWLLEYPFPGNVRELENIIAGAVILEKADTLGVPSVKGFEPHIKETKNCENGFATLAELEKEHLKAALEKTRGNRVETAKLLGINATTVYRKIQKYNLISGE